MNLLFFSYVRMIQNHPPIPLPLHNIKMAPNFFLPTIQVVAGMIDVGVLMIAAGAAAAAAAVAVTHRVAKLNFAVLWKISAPPLLGR